MRQRLEAQKQLSLARILFAANPVDRRERGVIRAREHMLQQLQAIANGGVHRHPNATSDTNTIIAFFQNLGGMRGVGAGIKVDDNEAA